MDTLTFTIPDIFLSYLVNGDHSGLRSGDYDRITRFEKKLIERYGTANLILSESVGFKTQNDVDRYAQDCHEMILLTKGENL